MAASFGVKAAAAKMQRRADPPPHGGAPAVRTQLGKGIGSSTSPSTAPIRSDSAGSQALRATQARRAAPVKRPSGDSSSDTDSDNGHAIDSRQQRVRRLSAGLPGAGLSDASRASIGTRGSARVTLLSEADTDYGGAFSASAAGRFSLRRDSSGADSLKAMQARRSTSSQPRRQSGAEGLASDSDDSSDEEEAVHPRWQRVRRLSQEPGVARKSSAMPLDEAVAAAARPKFAPRASRAPRASVAASLQQLRNIQQRPTFQDELGEHK
jgi:hypothetical protein